MNVSRALALLLPVSFLGFLAWHNRPAETAAPFHKSGTETLRQREEIKATAGSLRSMVKPGPGERQLRAAEVLAANGTGVQVEFDPVLGTACRVASPHTFLTAPAEDSEAVTIAREFLNGHREVFGHGAGVLSGATVRREMNLLEYI